MAQLQLSILLTTHAEASHLKQLLINVLQFQSNLFEVILINDAAGRSISQFIETEIEKSHHDRVFLFEHEKFIGRGASLNEALVQASGAMVWAPLRADRLNESLLIEAIQRFTADPAAFWTLDYFLPGDPMSWVTAAEEGELPDDSCLVWNKNVLSAGSFFFNPFLEQLHGAELAFRLSHRNAWHQTDPFFVVAGDQSICADEQDLQEFLYTALRSSHDDRDLRAAILNRLSSIETEAEKKALQGEYLVQARQHLAEGDANLALEMINRFLKKNPNHHEANRIKVNSLEKLRRHVEAAELKHDLQKRASDSGDHDNEDLDDVSGLQDLPPDPQKKKKETQAPKSASSPRSSAERSLSVIIPTTGLGRPLLEATLSDLEKVVKPSATELIVIDNASIDDTFGYLDQLQRDGFLNITVITNQTNRGFGASVNQGIEVAKGDFILVLHNDVSLHGQTVEQLMSAFQQSDAATLVAPVVDSTNVSLQKKGHALKDPFVLTDQADSCCFMLRNGLQARFDEEYHLCHFEMDDFCKQIIKNGREIIIARNTSVEHKPGTTIGFMGLELSPYLKWINRDRLHKKWRLTKPYVMPGEGTHPERFEQLEAPDNPLNPDPEWIEVVHQYLTSEVRTEILRGSWNQKDLVTITSTLIMADERELLRTMEDRLDGMKLSPAFLILFIQFYFNKNIYSRCRHYLDIAGTSLPIFDFYRLKIMVAEKELEQAAPLLTKMLEKFPASPDLFHLAGELYRHNGDEDEAKSFYAMAHQLDPFRFRMDDAAFEIKF